MLIKLLEIITATEMTSNACSRFDTEESDGSVDGSLV
jgi:hypothetical protein